MTVMKVRSLVMVFRTSYGVEGETRGGMAVALRGIGVDIPVGPRTEVSENCYLDTSLGVTGLLCICCCLYKASVVCEGVGMNRRGCSNNSSLQSTFWS